MKDSGMTNTTDKLQTMKWPIDNDDNANARVINPSNKQYVQMKAHYVFIFLVDAGSNSVVLA